MFWVTLLQLRTQLRLAASDHVDLTDKKAYFELLEVRGAQAWGPKPELAKVSLQSTQELPAWPSAELKSIYKRGSCLS